MKFDKTLWLRAAMRRAELNFFRQGACHFHSLAASPPEASEAFARWDNATYTTASTLANWGNSDKVAERIREVESKLDELRSKFQEAECDLIVTSAKALERLREAIERQNPAAQPPQGMQSLSSLYGIPIETQATDMDANDMATKAALTGKIVLLVTMAGEDIEAKRLDFRFMLADPLPVFRVEQCRPVGYFAWDSQ